MITLLLRFFVQLFNKKLSVFSDKQIKKQVENDNDVIDILSHLKMSEFSRTNTHLYNIRMYLNYTCRSIWE